MTGLITSTSNPKIKRLVRLRDRRSRDAEGVFLIEGFRELRRAVEAGVPINELYVCEDLFLGSGEAALAGRIAATGARLVTVAPAPFRKAAYRERPEGLLAVAPQFDTCLARITPPGDALILVAEGIEKPGNLGTMLRAADAAGAAALVVADPVTDPFNPNVVRASLGSLFTVPLAVGSTSEVMDWLGSRSVRTVVTTPAASNPHWEVDYAGRVAVAVGSEQYGLSDPWLDGRYEQARIPMSGSADSLNAATAAGIALFEAVRQRSSRIPSAPQPSFKEP